jgi:hypothetical protein
MVHFVHPPVWKSLKENDSKRAIVQSFVYLNGFLLIASFLSEKFYNGSPPKFNEMWIKAVFGVNCSFARLTHWMNGAIPRGTPSNFGATLIRKR